MKIPRGKCGLRGGRSAARGVTAASARCTLAMDAARRAEGARTLNNFSSTSGVSSVDAQVSHSSTCGQQVSIHKLHEGLQGAWDPAQRHRDPLRLHAAQPAPSRLQTCASASGDDGDRAFPLLPCSTM
jgi:hypothetical protein